MESDEFGFRPESLSVAHSCCRRNKNATLSFTFVDLTCSLIFLLKSSVYSVDGEQIGSAQEYNRALQDLSGRRLSLRQYRQ